MSGSTSRAPKLSFSSGGALELARVPIAVLAGGLATRLGAFAATTPKALVEVAGQPFVDHQLALWQRHGLRRVVVCVGHLGDQIVRHVGDGHRFGLDVTYSFDGERRLGTGGALRQAAPQLGDICWVTYGDAYLDVDYRAILATFADMPLDCLGLMAVYRNENQWDRSNVCFRDGRLVRYDKVQRTPDMAHIDFGLAVLRCAAIARIPVNIEVDLGDLYRDLVAGGRMVGYEVTQRFYEIGSPAGLAETRAHIAGQPLGPGHQRQCPT